MAGVGGVGFEVLFGVVAAVEHVGEGQGGGAVAEDGAHGEVLDLVEGREGAETVDHDAHLGRIHAVFDLEEDYVLHHGLC